MISSQPLPLSPVMIDTDEGLDASDVNPLLGLEIKDDGSVIIDLNPPEPDKSKEEFDENLALQMDQDTLGKLAEDLIQGIEADIQSRSEWEATRARGLDLLALKLEQPRANVNSSSAPIEGMSTVRHPLLLEAVLRHQANASGELLPADGPAKIRNDGAETVDTDKQAEQLEKDFNHYLTKTATEYYPDTRRTLFWSGFGGSGFKKLYHCPIRRRPVSESIDANDLIVSDAATDLANAPRVTHRIRMAPSIMRRMQIVGAYRDVSLGQPQPLQNPVDLKKESIEGVKAKQDRPEDQPYTLYECYCEVVLDEFAPKQFKGKELPLPFKITIDKDSREVLEVRRFWDEDDEQCLRKKRIVKYPYVEGMGLYGIGLVHILGNSTNALTAAWREALDAGMYASFPGFIYNKAAGRQLSNEFRVPPGGGVALDAAGGDIRAAVMPMPYKDVTPGLMTMIDKVTQACQSVGGTAELPVGEGKQDAPVGTTLALIEQSTKVESAVHKGLHQAQSEEFEIFLELFREDPEAFWRHNPKSKDHWNTASLLQALDNCKLVPIADPNTPSHLHRIAKALAIKQLQAANPSLYDAKNVDQRILAMIKVDDADNLFAPPAPPMPPPPDPNMVAAQAKMLQAQTGAQKVAIQAQNEAANNQEKAAQRASDEKIAQTKLATELVIHRNDQTMKRDDQKLNLAKHGLAAQQAAHSALMDVQGLNSQPLPQSKNGGRIKRADGGAVNLLQQAQDEYPVLRDLDIGYLNSPNGGKGFLEYWPSDEVGAEDRPRPSGLPLGKPGIEVYRGDTRPIDILGDIVSHQLVNTDPVIGHYYNQFQQSLTPNQLGILQRQYKDATSSGETRPFAQWAQASGLPAYFRGYAFQQWPQEETSKYYTPSQVGMFDEMMRYLRSGRQ